MPPPGAGTYGRQYLYLNNNNLGKLLLNNYSTVDAGNVVTIEEVDGVVLNEIEAIKIFNDTFGAIHAHVPGFQPTAI